MQSAKSFSTASFTKKSKINSTVVRPFTQKFGSRAQVPSITQAIFKDKTTNNATAQFSGATDLEVPRSPELAQPIELSEISEARQKWIEAVLTRDVKATVSLYDPEVGRLLGTIDTMETVERDSHEVITEYFNNFLGNNDAVEPRFPPRVRQGDVIQLGNGYAVYNGYYDFALTKGGQTNIAHAKFSYIYRRTPDGLKIVTHNSGLTPAGIEPVGVPVGPVTTAEVYEARAKWIIAVKALDVDTTVSLYDEEQGKLLGTIDTDESIERRNHSAIREYFNNFLGNNNAVVPQFPAEITDDDLVQLGNGYVAYNGYYTFLLTNKANVTNQAKAKFTYIYKRSPDGLKIVTHNSGLTPQGVTPVSGEQQPITMTEVLVARQKWIQAARQRNVDDMVGLYDPVQGRLLGTIDSRETVDRNNLDAIKEYFIGFLGGNDAVIADFDPCVAESDIIQLGNGYAVYNGYYDFTLKKDSTTRVAHAKFSYIYKRSDDGLKIVTHNSGLTPAGIETVSTDFVHPNTAPLTVSEVEGAVKEWVQAVQSRNVGMTVACYDPSSARLLGTIDDSSTESRTSIQSITTYFNNFLGNNDEVIPKFPKVTESDIIQLGDGHAIYNGYYQFILRKGKSVKTANAKFSYVYKRTDNGLKIVTHNSGLTPQGIVEGAEGYKK